MYKFSKIENIADTVRKFNEKNCCSVIGLSIVTGWSFVTTQGFLKEHCNRKVGEGLLKSEVVNLTNGLKGYGKVQVLPYRSDNRITVNNFCKNHNVGKFLVFVRGHCFAIKDGTVYDTIDKPRRQITYAIKLGE